MSLRLCYLNETLLHVLINISHFNWFFQYAFLFIDLTTNSIAGESDIANSDHLLPPGCILVCLQSSHYPCLSSYLVSAPKSCTKQREKINLLECLACQLANSLGVCSRSSWKHHLLPFVSKLNFMLSWANTFRPQEKEIWSGLSSVDDPCVTHHTCAHVVCVGKTLDQWKCHRQGFKASWCCGTNFTSSTSLLNRSKWIQCTVGRIHLEKIAELCTSCTVFTVSCPKQMGIQVKANTFLFQWHFTSLIFILYHVRSCINC